MAGQKCSLAHDVTQAIVDRGTTNDQARGIMSTARSLTTTGVALLAFTGFVTIAGLMRNSAATAAIAEPVSWVSGAGSVFPQHQPDPNPDCPDADSPNCPGAGMPGPHHQGPGMTGRMGPGQMGSGHVGPMGPMGPGQMGPGLPGS